MADLLSLDDRDRRIIKELQYIRTYIPHYKTISFNYIENKLYIDIKTEKGNILHFDIPKNYPFRGPILEIQTPTHSYSYKEQLSNMPPDIHYFIQYPDHYFKQSIQPTKKQRDLVCLCCKSILCEDNWSPIIMIYRIIIEIEKYNKIKKEIYYKLIVNRFCMKKRLPTDIIKPILDFLR